MFSCYIQHRSKVYIYLVLIWCQTKIKKLYPGSRISVNSSRIALKKRSRMRDTNLEKPVHCRNLQHRSKLTNAFIFLILKQSISTLSNKIMPDYIALEGTFDFNISPGWNVVIYENKDTWRTWAPHGSGVWFIGSTMEHYRCHKVYLNATVSERVGDTVEFFPHQTKMPFIISYYFASLIAEYLTEAILY